MFKEYKIGYKNIWLQSISINDVCTRTEYYHTVCISLYKSGIMAVTYNNNPHRCFTVILHTMRAVDCGLVSNTTAALWHLKHVNTYFDLADPMMDWLVSVGDNVLWIGSSHHVPAVIKVSALFFCLPKPPFTHAEKWCGVPLFIGCRDNNSTATAHFHFTWW